MDKVRKRGYQRMAMVVGGLALLVITTIGSIDIVNHLGEIAQGHAINISWSETVAAAVWFLAAGILAWLIVRVLARAIHRWAQLMGEK